MSSRIMNNWHRNAWECIPVSFYDWPSWQNGHQWKFLLMLTVHDGPQLFKCFGKAEGPLLGTFSHIPTLTPSSPPSFPLYPRPMGKYHMESMESSPPYLGAFTVVVCWPLAVVLGLYWAWVLLNTWLKVQRKLFTICEACELYSCDI